MFWDEAAYLGPPDGNWAGQMSETRGLILHIAEGSYQGTINWMRNPASDVSSQFVFGEVEGERAQMLDTALTAWTQGAGNGHWVSVENAGFWTGQFTPAQIEANAQLYAWLMRTHGCPATLADSPSGRGLGWHGMGGTAWGNHPNCPGPANVALRQTILDRAIQINNPTPPPTPEDEVSDMLMVAQVNEPDGKQTYWAGDGFKHRQVATKAEAESLVSAIQLFYGSPRAVLLTYGNQPRSVVLGIIGPVPADPA